MLQVHCLFLQGYSVSHIVRSSYVDCIGDVTHLQSQVLRTVQDDIKEIENVKRR